MLLVHLPPPINLLRPPRVEHDDIVLLYQAGAVFLLDQRHKHPEFRECDWCLSSAVSCPRARNLAPLFNRTTTTTTKPTSSDRSVHTIPEA